MRLGSVAVIVIWLVSFAAAMDLRAQGKPEKDKIRIGYAARAVAHSVPYIAKEAGFFAEEGIEVEVIRTAGNIAPMALVSGDVNFSIMSAFLLIPVSVQNRDVVMLGGFSRYATMTLVARPEIRTARELKGKIRHPKTGRRLRQERPHRFTSFGFGCRQGCDFAFARHQ